MIANCFFCKIILLNLLSVVKYQGTFNFSEGNFFEQCVEKLIVGKGLCC